MLKPCVECGGVEEHTIKPFCPAMIRGAGSRRDLCNSIYPLNHGYNRCQKTKGHEVEDPVCVFELGLDTGYRYQEEVLYQDAIHAVNYELE